MWLQIILLSFSLSIDALGIGISYAFRKVRIDGRARMAVGVISAVIMGAAVAVGGRIAILALAPAGVVFHRCGDGIACLGIYDERACRIGAVI